MIHRPEQSFAADRLEPLVVSFGKGRNKARIINRQVVRVEVRFRYWADAADRRWRKARMSALTSSVG